jgi:hypothetical protein
MILPWLSRRIRRARFQAPGSPRFLPSGAPGDKSEPETGRDGGSNQTENRSGEGSCGHFGEQDACAVRGGEVDERGARTPGAVCLR